MPRKFFEKFTTSRKSSPKTVSTQSGATTVAQETLSPVASTPTNNPEASTHLNDTSPTGQRADLPVIPAVEERPVTPATAKVEERTEIETDKSVTDVVAGDPKSRTYRSIEELTEAIDEFKKNYEAFSAKNRQFILIDTEAAFQAAQEQPDIRHAAKTFSDSIWEVLHAVEKKRKMKSGRWTTKLGNALSKLYPIARLSLGLAASFSPLKGTAAGLAIILQIIDDEANRGEDFLYTLRRIEFLAALITENPTYDLNSEMTRNLVEEKSRDLTTAIVRFFNGALIYFSGSFPGNLVKSIALGTQCYDSAQKVLDVAIREYDQAILNLAGRVIATMKYEQDVDRKEQRDEKFLKWLSPSHWPVEAQLHSFRQARGKETLGWARDLKEFQDWRLSDFSSVDRILWIRGTLGIGKSTMAGYLIDLLKCQYLSSIVAYFFCRSNQPGLTKACDIVRTLAYQLIDSDPTAFAKLESLRTTKFSIDDCLGVRFLFDKLVREPLQTCTKDIFIIVDGLDEADLTTIDATDRSEKTEMVNLLQCLTTLPSTRLLFFSRPSADIAKIIPTVVKPIGMAENREDINAYVAKTIAESERLCLFFEDEKVDPIEFFNEKSSGIFLWVVLVLQQLGKSKSKSIFRRRLNDFSDASGSMDKLYTDVLSRFEEDDKVWVTEILRWLVVAQWQFKVPVLQRMVEWSLKDSLADFQEFLEVECGSIVHLLPKADGSSQLVQLVHETFRSFILNPKKCPAAFLIDEKIVHCEAALACFSNLSDADASRRITYASSNWVMHLSKASTRKLPLLLFSLREFLKSKGLKLWMKDIVDQAASHLGRRLNPWETDVGNWHFERIVEWLQGCQSFWQKDGRPFGVLSEESQALLTNPSTQVGKCFGAAAWALWLSDTISCSAAETYFCVALKYYLRRQKCASILEEIAGLNATGFEELSKWACPHKTTKANVRNIGIAYYVLQQWDDCVRCLRISEQNENEASILKYLGNALMALGDYDGAIEVFWRMVDTGCEQDIWFRPGLLDAYEAKGEYDAAINQFQKAADRDPDNRNAKICLGYAYIGKADYDSAIKIFEELMPDHLWVDYGLCEAYMMARDYRGAIEMLNVRGGFSNRTLLSMYHGAGQYDEAIEAVTKGRQFTRKDRFEAYRMKGDAREAIGEFEKAIAEHGSRTDFDLHAVLHQYRTINEVETAISTFKTNKRLYERNGYYEIALIEAYTGNGEYDLAINSFEKNFDRLCDDYSLYHGLMAYMKKGDCERVLKTLQIPKVTKEIGRLTAYSVLQWCKAHNMYDQAIQLFESIERPFLPWVWHTLGTLYAGKGDNSRAIYNYHAASQQISFDISFQIALGKAHLANSSYQEAIAAFNIAIQKARSKSIATAYLNIRPYLTQRYIPIAIDAGFADNFLWYSLAKAYAATSDEENANNLYDVAINDYRVALRRPTRDDLLWQYAGHDYMDLAIGLFDVFHRKQPLPRQALWSALGIAYQCKGVMLESVKAFQQALLAEPDNVWLRDLVNKLELQYPLNEGVVETLPAGDIFEKRRTEGPLVRLRKYRSMVRLVY